MRAVAKVSRLPAQLAVTVVVWALLAGALAGWLAGGAPMDWNLPKSGSMMVQVPSCWI